MLMYTHFSFMPVLDTHNTGLLISKCEKNGKQEDLPKCRILLRDAARECF